MNSAPSWITFETLTSEDKMKNRNQSAGYCPPSRSNSSDFGRTPFIQALIDLAALASGVFLACATAAAIGVCLFILFFVRT
jgi:hypothetical protein